MEKADIEKRIETLRKSSQNNPDKNNLKNPNEKECPFRDMACGPHCRLFRNRKGYECPFMEIGPISFNFKELVKKIIG